MQTKTLRPTLLRVGIILFAIAGCADSESASVDLRIYGESFVEERLDTADGWTITFDSFVVRIDELTLGSTELMPAQSFDLTDASAGAGQLIASLTLPTGVYNDLEFVLHIASVSGAATKDGEVKTFDWTFEQSTRYGTCEEQVIVAAAGGTTTEITVHADHLFYDSLVSEEPNVLFQAIADADLDQDGAISQQELSTADIGAYDPGSTATVPSLWEWLLAQSEQAAHINGEGHCAQVR